MHGEDTKKISKGRRKLYLQDALIKIKTTQFLSNQKDPEVMEFVTQGKAVCKKNSVYLEYKESELSGLQGTTTILKFVDSGEIKLKRFGNQTSDMVFAKGKRFKTKYRTEYGTMSMEILTKDISVDILENPFDVRAVIQYDISVKDFFEGRNEMIIQAKKI